VVGPGNVYKILVPEHGRTEGKNYLEEHGEDGRIGLKLKCIFTL
jgi:hypothetical protein